jgi:hypothetical protein
MIRIGKQKNTKIPPMDNGELTKFVVAMCDGKVFTSLHVRDKNLLGMIFMPLVLGGLASLSKAAISDIGLIWEYLEQAGPRSINGYPIFFSARLMNRTDMERAMVAYDKEMARREMSAKTILSA